jgi:hypothetical protein|uniref:Uncharacterized protein n=1 Tax=uncultured Caudovirales phage TaxID=2100421 RepID=A0A6J7WZ50_9CAUD|nr:hypothetical protein UFOVP385_24 [uncultured Caudovirales phage]
MQTWTEDEIKELILFAQSLRQENEDLKAKIIAMDAMLKNEMAKVKQFKQILNRYTA